MTTDPIAALARELWDAYATSMQNVVRIKASEWDDLPAEIQSAWLNVAMVAMVRAAAK